MIEARKTEKDKVRFLMPPMPLYIYLLDVGILDFLMKGLGGANRCTDP